MDYCAETQKLLAVSDRARGDTCGREQNIGVSTKLGYEF